MTSRQIILASQSPRRVHLLKEMGLEFKQIPSKFEEYFDDSRPADEIAKELGLGKALDVAKDHPEAIVIGSDLVIEMDGKQIGKPSTEQEAKNILRAFSGRSHKLICSVAIVCLDKGYKRALTETSIVHFDKFSEDFIDEYVATGTTYDKAGGYAIQHPLVRPHVIKIEGRLDTIVGLSTNLVAELLRDFDINVSAVALEQVSPVKLHEYFT